MHNKQVNAAERQCNKKVHATKRSMQQKGQTCTTKGVHSKRANGTERLCNQKVHVLRQKVCKYTMRGKYKFGSGEDGENNEGA